MVFGVELIISCDAFWQCERFVITSHKSDTSFLCVLRYYFSNVCDLLYWLHILCAAEYPRWSSAATCWKLPSFTLSLSVRLFSSDRHITHCSCTAVPHAEHHRGGWLLTVHRHRLPGPCQGEFKQFKGMVVVTEWQIISYNIINIKKMLYVSTCKIPCFCKASSV
jgi:hypothetical protein